MRAGLLGAALAASLGSGVVYVMREDGRSRRELPPVDREPRAPGVLLDRATEPRFYALPHLSRRRRRRLRGKVKGARR